MSILSALYGRVTALRRRSYQRHPERQRRLKQPVISIGNVASGGSGKTPLVASLARLLQQVGRHPAVLSRGYGRTRTSDGALVVSDPTALLVSDARVTGDEPQMLARMLPGVPVVVCADRYLAGRLAESKLGATVHLLDDGFQHMRLARDIDLVLVSATDLDDRLLPAGHLREPVDAAQTAGAIVVPGGAADVERVRRALGHQHVFGMRVSYGAARLIGDGASRSAVGPPRAVIAVAAIARPRRFFDAISGLGYEVRREIAYRDHHWFNAADVARIEAAARDVDAALILTTEKDAVRLEPVLNGRSGGDVEWQSLPITATVEPEPEFENWLLTRLQRGGV